MNGTLFDILMVISLGILGGACFGLLIGYLAGFQEREWSMMTSRQKLLNCTLIVICSAACITVLAWYSLR